MLALSPVGKGFYPSLITGGVGAAAAEGGAWEPPQLQKGSKKVRNGVARTYVLW